MIFQRNVIWTVAKMVNGSLYHYMVGICGVLAGILDIFNGLTLLPVASLVNEWVYVATDFSILLLFVGLLGVLQAELTPVGLIGWLFAFFGFAFITGPSSTLGGVDAYIIGTSIIGVGLVLLSLSLLRINWIPRSIPLMFIAAILVSVLGIQFELMGTTIVLGNIILGLAFIELGSVFWGHQPAAS